MHQPKWNIDEVLLAVNTYLEIQDTREITPDNPKVIELSEILRSLPIHKNKNETFRNVAGVEMILKSIATLDVNSRYSMRAATKLQKNIYLYYIDRISKLRNIVSAIKACLPLPFEYYNPMDLNFNNFWQEIFCIYIISIWKI